MESHGLSSPSLSTPCEPEVPIPKYTILKRGPNTSTLSKPTPDAFDFLQDPKPTRFVRRATIENTKNISFDVNAIFTTTDSGKRFTTKTLLDTGCNFSSIDSDFVRKNGLTTYKFEESYDLYNADMSLNGTITDYVQVRMTIEDAEGQSHVELLTMQVARLGGKHDIFLGLDWCTRHNPFVDFVTREFTFARCPEECHMKTVDKLEVNRIYSMEEGLAMQDQEIEFVEGQEAMAHIRAFQSKSTEIAIAQEKKEFNLPEQYADFADVFDAKEFDQLPGRRPWDHAINLREGADGDRKLKGKLYPLNPTEQGALDAFLAENEKTGRIQPSQSPFAAPFFFVKKKDGALRPVQDYRRLNEWTIRDSWPATSRLRRHQQDQRTPRSFPRWTYVGASTMSASRKATSGKQRSSPTAASSNLRSCSSASRTPRRRSNT